MSNWAPFLATQIWLLPFVLLYIVGVVMALRRRDMGKASSYAAIGFAVLAIGSLASCTQMYLMMSMRMSGDFNAYRAASFVLGFSALINVCHFTGLGLLMAAIFAKRPTPQAA